MAPITKSKEQLLGFYVIDCADRGAAVAAARNLRRANPTAMYEIRPCVVLSPRRAVSVTEASIDGVAVSSFGSRNVDDEHHAELELQNSPSA